MSVLSDNQIIDGLISGQVVCRPLVPENIRGSSIDLTLGGDRFWLKVDLDGSVPEHRPELGKCWIWTASLSKSGYGQYWFDGEMRRPHRVLYEIMIAVLASGFELDHLCKNRACVNPTHVEPVTHIENVRRGRCASSDKTHCPQGHPYSGDNLYVSPRGDRHCRSCHRERDRRRRTRRRNSVRFE